MVVIGGGNSGVCAALAAAEAGASVAVVEVQAEADYVPRPRHRAPELQLVPRTWRRRHRRDRIRAGLDAAQHEPHQSAARASVCGRERQGARLDPLPSGFGHHRELRHFRRSEAHSLPRRDFRLSVCMQRATAVADASPCSTAPLSPVSASGGPPPWARSSARPWRRCNSFTQPSPQRPPRISAGAFVGKAFSALKVGAVTAGLDAAVAFRKQVAVDGHEVAVSHGCHVVHHDLVRLAG